MDEQELSEPRSDMRRLDTMESLEYVTEEFEVYVPQIE